jgi:hypothetical protein
MEIEDTHKTLLVGTYPSQRAGQTMPPKSSSLVLARWLGDSGALGDNAFNVLTDRHAWWALAVGLYQYRAFNDKPTFVVPFF